MESNTESYEEIIDDLEGQICDLVDEVKELRNELDTLEGDISNKNEEIIDLKNKINFYEDALEFVKDKMVLKCDYCINKDEDKDHPECILCDEGWKKYLT